MSKGRRRRQQQVHQRQGKTKTKAKEKFVAPVIPALSQIDFCRKIPPIIGFVNHGNTCYFNSVLQNLVGTTLLRNQTVEFYRTLEAVGRNDSSGITGAFKNVLGAVYSSAHTISPGSLWKLCVKRNFMLEGGGQQDAHELLRTMLDGIRSEQCKFIQSARADDAVTLGTGDDPAAGAATDATHVTSDSVAPVTTQSASESSSDESDSDDDSAADDDFEQHVAISGRNPDDPDTFIDEIFGGELLSTLTCHVCRKKSQIREPFLDLTLPLSSKIPSVADELRKQKDEIEKAQMEEQLSAEAWKPARVPGMSNKAYKKVLQAANLLQMEEVRARREAARRKASVAKPAIPVKAAPMSCAVDVDISFADAAETLVSLKVTPCGDVIVNLTVQPLKVCLNIVTFDLLPKLAPASALSLEGCLNEFVKPEVLEPEDMVYRCEFCFPRPKPTAAAVSASDQTANVQQASENVMSDKVPAEATDVVASDNVLVGAEIAQPAPIAEPLTPALPTTKQLVISKAPKVLSVCLKRFMHGLQGSKKISDHIQFPFELDLAPYCLPQIRTQSLTYRLYGIVQHEGSLNGGHYTAYVKREDQQWYWFSDQDKRPVKAQDVLKAGAYILFYERAHTVA